MADETIQKPIRFYCYIIRPIEIPEFSGYHRGEPFISYKHVSLAVG